MYRQMYLVFIVVVFAVGCSLSQETTTPVKQTNHTNHETAPASAKIIDTTGKQIGTASFTEMQNGVEMQLTASGLPPGIHGIHVHTVGQCTPPDFQSAKAHFNPTHKQHGKDNPKGMHQGDLLNLTVDQQGNAKDKELIKGVTLKPGSLHSLRHAGGTSIVIHEKEDDYKTDPSGNSGARIACGVIQ